MQTGNLLNPIYKTTNNRQGENTNLVSDLPKIASPQQAVKSANILF